MKKGLFKALPLVLFCANVSAQSFTEDFEGGIPTGWDTVNRSGPVLGSTGWFDGSSISQGFSPKSGSDFISANFNNVAGTGTVSNWLLSPKMYFNNSDQLFFYTRTVDSSGSIYPDRLEVRMSLNGSSVNVGTTPTDTGDFTIRLLSINPNLTATGYPFNWKKYSITISGLSGSNIPGRFAFRYFVTNSGPNGSNGDLIGIDSLAYVSVANGIQPIDAEPSFSVFPNPGNGLFSLLFSNSSDREIRVSNVLGETILSGAQNGSRGELDLRQYPKGVYFLTVKEGALSGTRRICIQ